LVLDSGAAAATDLPDVKHRVVRTSRAVVAAATVDGSRAPIDIVRMMVSLSSGFDAVVFPSNYSFVPVAPGPRVAVVVHDALPEAMPETTLGSRRARVLWALKNRFALWRADVIATVSEASADEIRRRLPIQGRPLTVLTEGAASVFSPQALLNDGDLVREAVGDRRRFLLYVGGISPHKRVPELVEAFGRVSRLASNRDLHLVLAGAGSLDGFAADGTRLSDAIAALGSDGDRVVRTGFVPDATLAALYRRADCVVLPSLMEGFGLPALEAMASGAPLVVTRTPALEELCGEAAEYADGIEHLSAAIARVLGSDERGSWLRRQGPLRAARFSWDEAARRLLASIEERTEA
jgi:glycosyltransferase involved in cell wall biosynthesis